MKKQKVIVLVNKDKKVNPNRKERDIKIQVLSRQEIEKIIKDNEKKGV